MRRIFMRKAAFVMVLVIAALVMMGCPSITQPVAATGNPIGSKTGTASGQIILGAFGDANASMVEAARSAGITQISTVDFTVKSMLGIVTTFTTTVTGE